MYRVEELLNAVEIQNTIDDLITIDVETRQIQVPSSELLFGVENDKKSERKHFECPKNVGNNLDLTKANVYINYQNANGDKDIYVVQDVVEHGDNVAFSWELGKNVTQYKGEINFIICAKWSDKENVLNEWNTTLAQGTSLQGLEATQQLQDNYSDLLEQLINIIDTNIKKKLVYDKNKRNVILEG